MKRIVAIGLAVMLLCAGFAACAQERPMEGNLYLEGLPLVKEPATLRVLVSRAINVGEYKTMRFYNDIAEQTGVTIDWIEWSTDVAAEKLSTMLAGADYPDISFINLGDATVLQYGQYGEVLALDDLVEAYAPNWAEAFAAYPEIKSTVTYPDGHIYSLPFVRMDPYNSGMRDAVLINKTWLDKLNLALPTTMDEFYEVLSAFKTQDPNGNGEADEIPYMTRYWTYSNGICDIVNWFGSPFGSYSSDFSVAVEDGAVYMAVVQPEFKLAVAYLNRLYSEGLMDPEVITQSTAQFQAKCKADPLIVGVTAVYHGGPELGLEIVEANYVALPPLQSDSGKAPIVRQQQNTVERGRAILFRTNPYPELSMRWLDTLASKENSFHGFFGYEGTHVIPLEDGTFDPNPDRYTDRMQDIPVNTGGSLLLTPDVILKLNKVSGTDLLRKQFYEVYESYVMPLSDTYPMVMFTEDQADRMVRAGKGELETYLQTTVAKWIAEGGIESEWDAYCAQVETLAAPILAIYQEALDTYYGK